LIGLVVAAPGAGYLLWPLWKKRQGGDFEALTHLSQLRVGVPQSFAIIEGRRDAWVHYPREPVGSVWLIRQPEGSTPAVLAFTSECPHLGCAVNLGGDGKSFLCPCHTSAFGLDGTPRNQVPPRPMDSLEVQLGKEADPEVRVKFDRFRAQAAEKISLA
jgi:menaquinol-cytochrome c reductase iron-sulfur subunit